MAIIKFIRARLRTDTHSALKGLHSMCLSASLSLMTAAPSLAQIPQATQLPTSSTVTKSTQTPFPAAPPEERLSLSEERWLQAQTYRADSEAARRFAFQASLERVRLVGKFNANTAQTGGGGGGAAAAEITVGHDAAIAVLADKPLHSDISLQTYINLLGRWISLESPRPELPWSFAVLGTQDAMVYAIPGSTVLITQGMIAKTGTEAELAGVLAQTIAHVNAHVAGNTPAQGLAANEEIAADRQALLMLTRSGFNPLAMRKAITLTGSNATPKSWLSSLLAPLAGPDLPTQQRLAQLKTFMGSRFDAYSFTPSVPVAERLVQLNTPTATTSP